MQTFDEHGVKQVVSTVKKTFSDDRYKYTTLKLMQTKDGSFKEVHELPIRSTKIKVDFSPDGRYLAVLEFERKEEVKLQIFEIQEKRIKDLFTNKEITFLEDGPHLVQTIRDHRMKGV